MRVATTAIEVVHNKEANAEKIANMAAAAARGSRARCVSRGCAAGLHVWDQ